MALPTADVHESLISSSEKMHLTGLWILSLFKSDILSTASIIVLVLITTSVFVSFGIADLYSMNVLDKTGDNSVIFDFECDMSLTDDNFRIFFVIGEEFKHLVLSFSRNNKTVFAFRCLHFHCELPFCNRQWQ